ncbi:MAG: methyltransferase type 11 [Spirochaetes bacterium RBG_16_67_19]|nr:MAG: methyltransferase type 11 [Spirochaetes bacterium RBG_16_67_19]
MAGQASIGRTVDRVELQAKVKDMYRAVAQNPHGRFHFELGRGVAQRLGYPASFLDRLPEEAIDSFAGVGYHLGLADLREGERVLDLGSGAGMDSFLAAFLVAPSGSVVGIDMTEAQLEKAEALRARAGAQNVSFWKGNIEALPFGDAQFDAVISNGVINLSPEKERIFQESSRVLKPGGRLAISDIVSEQELPEGVTCDATLWAACIGGAMQWNRYTTAIEQAGFRLVSVRENQQYEFLSSSAREAVATYGVKSVSLVAVKK